MKKNFIRIVIVLLMFCFIPTVFAAKKEPKVKFKIELTTSDKFILSGDLYVANPATSKPLVVLLHSFSMSSKVWNNLALNLRQKGYNVLAMDLRGHGRSIYDENLKIKSRYKFQKNDWQKLPNDIIESIDYVKSHYPRINCNNTIFVGADIGASAGIIAGDSISFKPSKFVLISPMLNFKGLFIPIKIANYTDTRFLILLSKTDKILFNFYTKTKPIIKTYQIGGPGNQLLKANPTAVDDIINFIIN